MKSNNCVVSIAVLGLLLTLSAAASWGQRPAGNDTSLLWSTGGGTGALVNNVNSSGFGVYNTAYGYNALFSNTYAIDNTAVGALALSSTTGANQPIPGGSYNTAVGALALTTNTASYNTAIGHAALYVNSSGQLNTAAGSDALTYNTTGSYNTAVGSAALTSNHGGNNNTALGYTALANNTGGNNTASGSQALYSNTTGNYNTATGYAALASNSTGGMNTAGGYQALYHSTSALNTALGYNALFSSTTGSRNLALGWSAGYNQTTGSGNIYLANLGVAGESSTMRLGQDVATGGDTVRTFIAGIVGVPVTGSQVLINSQGQLGILASSARYKRDILPMGERSHRMLKLRPVTFRYKNDPTAALQYGLIAEEVAKVYPELVVRGAKGEVESVQYHQLIPMLLNEMQHQQKQLAELQAQNARLQSALAEQNRVLAARLERLEAAARKRDAGYAQISSCVADLK